MARVGYIRFSTADQNGAAQEAALTKAGCTRIFRDEAISGKLTEAERDGLREALAYLRPGDTLVVAILARLGRDMLNLIALVSDLTARDITVETLDVGVITTKTATEELLFHIRAALTQWERRIILERTLAALDVAREKHGFLGPERRHGDEKMAEAVARWQAGEQITVLEAEYGVSRSTIHRARKRLAAASTGE